jgi:hypothetical protein
MPIPFVLLERVKFCDSTSKVATFPAVLLSLSFNVTLKVPLLLTASTLFSPLRV